MKAEEVKQIIREAFADMPYPDDHKITEEHHCDECYEVAEALRGRCWQDITPEFLSRYRGLLDAFPLLYPVAARYFMPAYLLALIECHDEDSLGVFPEYFLYFLANDSPEQEQQFFLERFDPLSKDQKRAVRLSLEYLVEVSDDNRKSAEKALETYWRDK